MIGYVIRRLIYVIAILAVMSILVFAVTQALPGNVAQMILGRHATPELLAALEAKMHLNDPWHVQYGRWAYRLLQGDFGESLVMQRPIAPILWDALGRSAVLATAAFLILIALGIGLGVISAAKKGTFVDHSISTVSYLGISVPEFFWGIVFVVFFAGYLGLLPATGYVSPTEDVVGWLSHLVLPVLTLTLTTLAHATRQTRSSMLDVLQSNYVRFARAKGLPERTVITRHALRNGLLPTITVLAQDFGWLVGGIIVVEMVFAIPGMGRMLVLALEHRDLPVMQAVIMVTTAIYALANLAADLLYAYFNPKIRYVESV